MKAKRLLARCFPGTFKPKWNQCRLSSNWDGKNAERRMMNLLSPHFSDGKVKDYLKWQKGRGADHVHLILANHADGEGGGYSIYGDPVNMDAIDKAQCKRTVERIKQCRRAGFGVVLWLMTDDSTAMNRILMADADRYLKDLARLDIFRYASTVCLGLELTEYASLKQVEALASATRHFAGKRTKIATHHNSYRTDFAHIGNLLFYQVSPGANAQRIRSETAKALKTGKPVNFFELDRQPNRELCQVALDAGAYACGNC